MYNLSEGFVVDELAPEGETDQKRMDDLGFLRVKSTELLSQELPADYFRCLNIKFRFKIPLGETRIEKVTVSSQSVSKEFYYAKPLRSNDKATVTENPYRKPSIYGRTGKPKLYYEMVGGNIELLGAEFHSYVMEYYKTPMTIFFDPTLAAHANCELRPRVQQMIVDRAVRIYIERTENVRYQSVLNEDQLKSFNN